MGLLQGSFNWLVYETFGNYPTETDLFDYMTSKAPFKEGYPTDLHSIGFCDWNNLSNDPTQESTFLADGWVLFGIRKDSKRVPKTLLSMEFRNYLSGLTAEQKKGLNKKMILSELSEKLLQTIPFTPSIINAAWHKPSNRLYVESATILDWLSVHLSQVGIKLQPALFLDPLGKAFEMIRDMKFDGIHLDGAPSLVPDMISFAPSQDLVIQIEDRKVSFLGSDDADLTKIECDSLINKGGKIVKMKIITNLDDDNYVLSMNSSSPHNLKFNPGNIRGSQYDKLFHRLERAVALTYTLEKVVLAGAKASA